MELIYLARQPIFDRRLNVVGYELLYRAGPDPSAIFDDEDRATMTVVDNALVEFGLDNLVGSGRAFINVTGDFLDQGLYRVFHPDRIVLELIERTVIDEPVRNAAERARVEGYTVALDDFTGDAQAWPLVKVARMVKVDLVASDLTFLDEHMDRLKQSGVTLVAEKVETYEDLERCRALGFDLFQGFFFERPIVLSRNSLAPDRLASAQLLAELHNPDADIDDIAEIIRRDVGLTYRILTIVNSALYSLPHRVEAISQAIVLLGLDMIRNFASLIAMSRVEGKPSELVHTAVVRARMCERLAKDHKLEGADGAFMVGLLSVLEALMDAPLPELLSRLPLAERVETALMDRVGPLGDLLNVVEAYERGDMATLQQSRFPLPDLAQAYLDTLGWVLELRASLLAVAPEKPAKPAKAAAIRRLA